MINSTRLLERFLRYVQVGTAADPDSDTYPSSVGQLELGKMLVAELLAMGIDDAHQDEHGLVWGTVPASTPGDIPTVLFNAHVDTSPEAPGDNVKPQVIESYAGGDIPLARDQRVIRTADCPALIDMIGQCLITTDGTTLLGGDDKAGVAAIMELAHHLIENTHIPHGPVRVLFTCDEEIGHGAKHMDLAKAGAAAAYTLDGSGQGEVENENFSADQIVVTVHGYNIHPSIGKDKMINASRGLALLLAELPLDHLTPETTDGKQGFLHAYNICGDVSTAEVRILLRDFETSRLDDYAAMIDAAAQRAIALIPGLRIDIKRNRQYRNMADSLRRAPQVVDFAMLAHQQLGHAGRLGSIRGGTDGAMFSEMGLPTPNLSVGQHNIHSVLEFASLNEMTAAVEHAIKLLELWQTHARS
ncbi:MAG: peptidase T [Pirellulaceae bacterium]